MGEKQDGGSNPVSDTPASEGHDKSTDGNKSQGLDLTKGPFPKKVRSIPVDCHLATFHEKALFDPRHRG